MPAPVRPVSAIPSETGGSRPLRAPVIVVAPDGEHELVRGALIIGRSSTANIRLEDPLVSREHARLAVLPDGSVSVEDLHSTNGIFVNGTRITRATHTLHDGDRVLVGTTELSVFAARSRPTDDPTPRAPRVSLRPVPREPLPSTDRADAIDVIGKLAIRHACNGNVAEGVRILSSHLNKVLLGATAGLPVPDRLLERATEFGLQLFEWTSNVAWFDYAIELHLAAQRAPSEASLTSLEKTAGRGRVAFDRTLLRYLVEKLEAKTATLTEEERARVERLARLPHGP